MQQISKRIASKISDQLGYDDEKSAVIAYGMQAILQMTVILLYTILFGLLTGSLWPALAVNFTGGLLRRSTGGAHISTMAGCILVSCTVISALAACSVYLMPFITVFPAAVAFVLLFFAMFLIAFRYVPVDSPNKPIRRPEKIRRLRRQSFLFLGFLFAVCAGLLIWFMLADVRVLLYQLFWAVLLGAVWQMFTLTPAGRKIISSVDTLLPHKSTAS